MKRIILAGLLVAFLSGPSNIRAETVKLATGEWTPYTSANLEGYGFFTKIVTVVLKEMGVEADYAFYPWRRCYDAVLKGRVWAAFPYSYTEGRAEQVLYSDEISSSVTKLFYYKKSTKAASYRFNTLEDLRSSRLGGVKGYYYEEMFTEADLKLDYSPTEASAVEKLRLGRIDLLPVNEMVGWDLIRKLFPDEVGNFGTLEKPLSSNALHLIVSKQRPGAQALLDRFNSALKICKDRGLIDTAPH